MRLRLVRHATLDVAYAGRRLLVDPMLGDAGSMPAIPGTANQRPNPLTPLPVVPADLLDGLDGVLLTHLHEDHLDDAALALLPRDVPVLCQPADVGFLASRQGFAALLPVESTTEWEGIAVARTGGQHGTGAIGAAMAPVSGFVLRAPREPVLYVAGDTVWCDDVRTAIDLHRPDVIVVNAGAARFLEGDAITMTAADVRAVAAHAPEARVVAVHMEAINHCGLTRADLRAQAGDGIAIPADGEAIAL